MTILAPVTKSESSTDPRDPLARLENLFDPGTTVPLHARDKSGVLAASGNIDGVRTIAYCSDATVMGGATPMTTARFITAPMARMTVRPKAVSRSRSSVWRMMMR